MIFTDERPETKPYRIGWHGRYNPWWKGWRRPWQAESSLCRFARRAFTPGAAQRKIEADAAHVLRYGTQPVWQRWRVLRAWFSSYERQARRSPDSITAPSEDA